MCNDEQFLFVFEKSALINRVFVTAPDSKLQLSITASVLHRLLICAYTYPQPKAP
jgi:hypothetical protein